jgi:hypothetical protein
VSVRSTARWGLPALLALVVATLGWRALPAYSVHWDEALGDLFFGERYLHFWTSGGDARYLDFRADPFPEGHRPDLGASPFRVRPWEHYPFAATLGAASAQLLARTFGWLDSFDAFHAVNLLFAAVWIVVFHAFLRARWGALVALLGVALPLAAPRVVAHLLVNVKDFPTMVLFTLAAVAAHAALERGSARGLLGAGALWGCALATKANALFLPLLPLGVLALGGVPESWRGRRRTLALAGAGALALGARSSSRSGPTSGATPPDGSPSTCATSSPATPR